MVADTSKTSAANLYEDEDELDLVKLVSTSANDANQYVVFSGSNGELYAKNVSKLEELLVYKDLRIAKNSDPESLVIGTADIRGRMTTLINFDEWMGNEVLDDSAYELVVMASYGGHRFGMIIKSVENIVTIEADEMVDNSNDNPKSTFITKLHMRGKTRLCTIFDSDKLLLDIFDKIDGESRDALDRIKSVKNIDKKILFCDDSRFVRKMVEDLFIKLDVKYEIYDDGKDLYEDLPNINVDEIGLFITDLEMPGMGGRELMQRIRADEAYEDIAIIVHTNMANDAMESALKDQGANAVIGKINMLQLGEAIKEHIRS
jgi:two-component system chemotaxis response regulator CheV